MIEHAGISEQGHVRFRNEDFLIHQISDGSTQSERMGSLFVVADGVGGTGAGDVASREAGQTLLARFYASRHSPEKALREALRHANMHIYDLAMHEGRLKMETTVSALAIAGRHFYIAHVGDSRIYRIRGRSIVQLTRDHSEVAELVRMQILTPENARHHPRRHIITRSVGSALIVQPMTRTEPLEEGDVFVLCTDGVWEAVSDVEIAGIVTNHSSEDACRRLIALALERQSTDNLSVQVLKVWELPEGNKRHMTNNIGLWGHIARLWSKPVDKTQGSIRLRSRLRLGRRGQCSWRTVRE